MTLVSRRLVFTNRGLTLIELIVVIGIISVLAAGIITIIDPFGQIQKARDANRKSDLTQIQKALEIYYQDYGSYPGVSGQGTEISYDGNYYSFGEEWPGYMSKIPNDPKSAETHGPEPHYQYLDLNSGQSYCLYAHLERGDRDSSACNNGNRCLSLTGISETEYHCGRDGTTETCNYGLCSSDITP